MPDVSAGLSQDGSPIDSGASDINTEAGFQAALARSAGKTTATELAAETSGERYDPARDSEDQILGSLLAPETDSRRISDGLTLTVPGQKTGAQLRDEALAKTEALKRADPRFEELETESRIERARTADAVGAEAEGLISRVIHSLEYGDDEGQDALRSGIELARKSPAAYRQFVDEWTDNEIDLMHQAGVDDYDEADGEALRFDTLVKHQMLLADYIGAEQRAADVSERALSENFNRSVAAIKEYAREQGWRSDIESNDKLQRIGREIESRFGVGFDTLMATDPELFADHVRVVDATLREEHRDRVSHEFGRSLLNHETKSVADGFEILGPHGQWVKNQPNLLQAPSVEKRIERVTERAVNPSLSDADFRAELLAPDRKDVQSGLTVHEPNGRVRSLKEVAAEEMRSRREKELETNLARARSGLGSANWSR